MLSNTQRHQLQTLKDIGEISGLCSTKTYVWGGLVMDMLEGRFLREHGDIDCFTLNLLDVKEHMDSLFSQRGYETGFTKGIDMYNVQKDGCCVAFNRLELDNEIAMWRHIGDYGTLYFPKAWLSDSPRLFYETSLLISGIEFEYSIKAKVTLLSPEWQLRESDKAALDYYTKALKKHNIASGSVLKKVWSDNPYWRKKGYKE
jgi:hypothetical protein